MPHHRRARDLAERPDMRQPGRAIAGLEQHIALLRRRALGARHQLARLLERPCLRRQGEIAGVGHLLFAVPIKGLKTRGKLGLGGGGVNIGAMDRFEVLRNLGP
jgi:hypothetical protein